MLEGNSHGPVQCATVTFQLSSQWAAKVALNGCIILLPKLKQHHEPNTGTVPHVKTIEINFLTFVHKLLSLWTIFVDLYVLYV